VRVPVWSAEVTVDEPLARRLVADQFPELAEAPLRRLAEGWDNVVWLVGERWAFRFPQRTMGAELIERELRVLPLIAPALPAPVPIPVFAGWPGHGYPWSFFGAPLLPGVEACDAALDDEARCRLAPVLGRFLRALHDMPIVDGLLYDPNGRADMRHRAAMTREWMEQLGRRPDGLDALLEEAEALPPPEGEVVAHGDLHIRHVMVDPDGELTGVIDWGDVCRADPSIDLSLLWSFFPAEGRAALLAEYGPVSEVQLLRARALAVNLSVILAVYGREQGMSGVEREALEGLGRCLS
jgi:aminoglycoside phosphotransferase (APT) family kinase protein